MLKDLVLKTTWDKSYESMTLKNTLKKFEFSLELLL